MGEDGRGWERMEPVSRLPNEPVAIASINNTSCMSGGACLSSGAEFYKLFIRSIFIIYLSKSHSFIQHIFIHSIIFIYPFTEYY